MQMCPFCDSVYDESEYTHCPYCSGDNDDDDEEVRFCRNVMPDCTGMVMSGCVPIVTIQKKIKKGIHYYKYIFEESDEDDE